MEVAFFKDYLLIIWFYWTHFCFFRIKVNVCRNKHIRKDKNKLGTSIVDKNRDKKVHNPGINIIDVDVDGGANNQSIKIVDEN